MIRGSASLALALPLALAAPAAPGCGRSTGVPDEALGGLVIEERPHERPVDVARAAREPAELGRALARPHRQLAAALGPHTARIEMTNAVLEGGQQVSALDDETVIELGEGGAFRARYESSGDYGREAIYLPAGAAAAAGSSAAAAAGSGAAAAASPDGTLYLRPRYQRWHARAPEEPGEPAALRDEYFGGIAAVWDLLAPGAELTDRGAVQVAGRAGRRVEVKLSPKPAAPPPERLAQRKWREARTIEALAGEVVLDAEAGVPLAVKLTGAIGFLRDGRRFTMKLGVDGAISGIGAAVAIAAPPATDVVATPERLREVDDRDFLLQGIAPPLRRGSDGARSASPPAPEAKP